MTPSPLLAVLFAGLLLTGCLATPAHSQIDLTVEGTKPTSLKVTMTNNLDRTVSVTNQGFRLVDSEGLVIPLHEDIMESLSNLAFPYNAELYPGESVQGRLAFWTRDPTPPYTLHYNYEGIQASATVDEQAAPQPTTEPTTPEDTPTPPTTPSTENTSTENMSRPGNQSINPAPLGTWVNGTEVDIRLASVERYPYPKSDVPYANYTFEFRYHTERELHFDAGYFAPGRAMVDMRTTWVIAAHDRGGAPVHLKANVPDWDLYFFHVT